MRAVGRKRSDSQRDPGVGTQFVVIDVDGDVHVYIVTSIKKGVFAHLQR